MENSLNERYPDPSRSRPAGEENGNTGLMVFDCVLMLLARFGCVPETFEVLNYVSKVF